MTSTAVQRNAAFSLSQAPGILVDYVVDYGILAVAYLIAIYLRQTLPYGKFVGGNYQWQDPQVYFTLAFSLALAYLLRLLPEPGNVRRTEPRLRTPIVGMAFSLLGLAVLTPQQSGLEKAYYAVTVLALSLLVHPWPQKSEEIEARPSLDASLARLWANRSLLLIWVKYNVQSRYAQALLGILWIVLLPLSTAVVMSIVFSEIMRVSTGNVPFISFFLAGLVPWGLFSQAISSGMRSTLGTLGLINQIYFPREIIVLSALGEALVDAFFMFVAMLLVNAIVGLAPNPLYAILPLLLAVQIAFSLGLMFIVSWFSVLIRDIPQLVSVLLQVLFYLCPIIYPVTIIPERYRFLIALNPIAVLIEAYRSVIVYNRPPDWQAMVYPAAWGIALLIFGYRLFKANEDRFADLV